MTQNINNKYLIPNIFWGLCAVLFLIWTVINIIYLGNNINQVTNRLVLSVFIPMIGSWWSIHNIK